MGSGERPRPSGEKPVSSRRVLAWGAALALWVCFVWGHSLVGGAASSLESGRFVALLRPAFEALGVTDVDLMTFIVRKCAHFSEYAVLGGIARMFWLAVADGRVRERARRGVLLAGCALTAAVPCIDETIQLFVPGRAGQVRDVLIDLSGAATGALLCWAIACMRRRRRSCER